VTIIDWYSRFIVGYALSNTMQSDFVIRAMKDAIKAHGAPEIINSDQGSQLHQRTISTASRATRPLKSVWMARGANDNARTERFFRSYKWERLYLECPEPYWN
jgi:putative transposase